MHGVVSLQQYARLPKQVLAPCSSGVPATASIFMGYKPCGVTFNFRTGRSGQGLQACSKMQGTGYLPTAWLAWHIIPPMLAGYGSPDEFRRKSLDQNFVQARPCLHHGNISFALSNVVIPLLAMININDASRIFQVTMIEIHQVNVENISTCLP